MNNNLKLVLQLIDIKDELINVGENDLALKLNILIQSLEKEVKK